MSEEPYQSPQTESDPAASGMELTSEVKMWAMICHLIALAGFVLPVPFFNIIGPVIVWQIKKDEHPFINEQGKEAVNFQISLLIYTIIAAFSILILIGFVLLPVVIIAGVVLVVIAGIKANNGEHYRYPFTIRLIN